MHYYFPKEKEENEQRNVCLSVRTTREISKELEKYEEYRIQKSTVAHKILEKVLSDLSCDDIRRIVCRFPETGWRLKIVKDTENNY